MLHSVLAGFTGGKSLKRLLLSAVVTFLVAPAAFAASFSCESAKSPAEKAICGNRALSMRDEEMAAAYDKATKESGKDVVQAIARKLLEKRRSCGDDVYCIAAIQFEALDLFAVLGGEGRSLSEKRDRAGGRLAYGGKGPMRATITSASGIGTANAVITIANLRRDASGVCEAFNSTVPNCTENVLNTPLATAITANCDTGDFTSLYGARLRFETSSGDPTGYQIVNRDNGEPLATAQATGFYAALEQFDALCSGKVPE